MYTLNKCYGEIKTTQREQGKPIFRVAIAQESASDAYIVAETQMQIAEWESILVDKEKALDAP